MSEENTPEAEPAAAAPAEDGVPRMRVLAQFTKDLSFENPGVLASQNNQNAPEIDLGIDVRVEPGSQEESIYGVDLKLSAQAKRGDQVVFIVELVYSGVFQLQDVDPKTVEPMLLIECPRLLFPFARSIVAEVTRDGGHPPLMVDPIDFVGLYQKQKADQQAAKAEAGGSDNGEAPAS